MRTTFLFRRGITLLCAAIIFQSIQPVFAADPSPADFVGTYEGTALKRTAHGQSLVENLEITRETEVYTLNADMNDANREPGMDHRTSNSRWSWTASGKVEKGVLTFNYSSADGKQSKGSVQRQGTSWTLTLGDVRYRLRRAKKP